MFARKSESHGIKAPGIMGTSSPEDVAQAVLKAIQKDLPEVIVNSKPVRPFLAISSLFPRFAEWLSDRIGLHSVSQRALETEDELHIDQ